MPQNVTSIPGCVMVNKQRSFSKTKKKCFLPLTICGKKLTHVLPSSHDLDSGHDTDWGDEAGPGHRGGDVQRGAETVARRVNLLFEDAGSFVCFFYSSFIC